MRAIKTTGMAPAATAACGRSDFLQRADVPPRARGRALAQIVRLGALMTGFLIILATMATDSFALRSASWTPKSVPANVRATQSSTPRTPLIILPSNKACVAGGKLTVQFNSAPHGPWAKVTIYLNGKRLKILKRHITRLVTVTGLPRGSFIIAVTGVTRAGRVRDLVRRYTACATESEAREKAEREAREKAEREAREKAEREAREKAEREAREKAEREAKEKAEREAKEKAEREAKEKAEREAKEKAEREAKEPPAGVEAGSYSGTDTQGYGMSFYVSPGGGQVQNVVVSTTAIGCTPSKSFDDHFEVTSITIGSEGDFSSTTEYEGVIEHAPAKFKYTISGHLSGASASGSIREDISLNGTEYSCTTNTLAWSLTRESVQTEASFPPAAGSYSGTDHQGYGMSFYVSPGGGEVQNVVVSTTIMGCTPSEEVDDHFEVASVAINPDGSFSSTTEQEGVLKHLPAKFKYTLSGQFHGTGSAGVVRVAGTLREDITYENGSKFECTTNGEDWSLTRESVQTEASFPPAAGSYSGTDHQGYGMSFYVSPGGGEVQNVVVSTTIMGCTPSEEVDDHFEVASVAINPDGSFSSTTEQEGVLKHLPAKFKYTLSGQFHGTGSAGVVRVAGTLREDITYENGSKFECTTNGEDWSLTRESVQTEASFPPAAGSYSGTDHQGYGLTFEVASGGTKLQNVSVPTVVLGCTPAKEADLAFVIKEATIGSDGAFTAKETESAMVFGVIATVTYEFSGQFHGTGSGGEGRVAGTLREKAVDESGKTFECTSNGQSWEAKHS